MSFQKRLVISLALLLLPLVASEAYFLYRQYAREKSTALSEQLSTANQLAISAEDFVARTVALEAAVGEALVGSHWHDVARKHAYTASIAGSTPTVRWIALADPFGRVVESAPASGIGLDVSDRAYFSTVRNGAPWTVSDLLVSRIDHTRSFVIAAGIRSRGGRLEGVVASGVDVKGLPNLHPAPTSQTRLVLIDRRGQAVLMSNMPTASLEARDWSNYSFVKEALRGYAVRVPAFRFHGSPTLTGAMVPVPDLGWAAGSFLPRELVTAPVRAAAERDLLITLGVLLATLVIGLVIARQMTAPIEYLSKVAERLGRGDLSARAQISAVDELAALGATMNRMAQSIERAYERERRIATVLQERMLPQVPQRVGRLEIATGYFPALEEAELGGDFYDVILLPDGLVGIVIADVSGKGLAAAVHTAMVKYTLEGFASVEADPAVVVKKLNQSVFLYKRPEDIERFVTLFVAIVDSATGELSYANAGHPPPLVRHEDGTTDWLHDTTGLPLGISDRAEYDRIHTRLSDGDLVIFYTDGVVEAHREGRWFRPESLEEFVRKTTAAPEQFVHAIYDEVSGSVGGRVPDDVALVAVKLLPDAGNRLMSRPGPDK